MNYYQEKLYTLHNNELVEVMQFGFIEQQQILKNNLGLQICAVPVWESIPENPYEQFFSIIPTDQNCNVGDKVEGRSTLPIRNGLLIYDTYRGNVKSFSTHSCREWSVTAESNDGMRKESGKYVYRDKKSTYLTNVEKLNYKWGIADLNTKCKNIDTYQYPNMRNDIPQELLDEAKRILQQRFEDFNNKKD